MTTIQIRTLGPNDFHVLENVATDVFDYPIRPDLAKEFLADPRHHIVVALESQMVVGFASGVHYIHPDKEAELFINEVGVSPEHQRRGIGKSLIAALVKVGQSHGCVEAWVLAHTDNDQAKSFYKSIGGAEESPHSVLYSFSGDGRSS